MADIILSPLGQRLQLELRKIEAEHVGIAASGTLKTFEDYRERVGFIRATRRAIELIEDIEIKLREGK